MSNQLTQIYLALLDFIAPLRLRLQSLEGLEYLFYRYGWNATLDSATMSRIQSDLTVVAPLEAFATVAENLEAKLAANPDAQLSAADVESLLQAAGPLVAALAQFKLPDLSGLADPLGRPEFWESIAENIFDDLLEEYLRIYHPGFYLVLRVFGVVRFDATVPTEAARQPYTRTSFDWSRAVAALKDPLTALKTVYHWGDPATPFAYEEALAAMAAVLHALGVTSSSVAPAIVVNPPFAPDSAKGIANDAESLRIVLLSGNSTVDKAFYNLGFEIYPALRTGEAQPSGLMLRPIIEGGASTTLPLGKSLKLTWTVAASLDNVIGFAVFPSEYDIIGGAPALGTSLVLSLAVPGPLYLLGNANSSRIEVSNFSLGLSLGGSLDDPELAFQLSCAGAGGTPGCKVVVPLGDADSFVSSSVKQNELDFSFSPTILWSTKSGFSFNGNAALDIDLPLGVGLGPITITDANLSFGEGSKTTSSSTLSLIIGLGIKGQLGPIGFVVDRMGFECDLVPYSPADVRALPAGSAPALGSLDVQLGFAPPKGVGLSVDAAAVSGGGYLSHSNDQYSGALELSICGVAVKAFGLIETQLPGGVKGYSALVILTAEFSPGLQIGYDFTLDGVGGLLGINRTVSTANVETAIWAHHFDGLLFPKNPVTAAPALMAAIDSYFPAAEGRYLFGPLAKIGWGDGMVEVLLGLVIELPEPIKLLLLGEVDVQVPVKLPQLNLHIDFAGGIDFGQKLAFFDASLHDSKIERYPLGGDLAFRYDWGDAPVFALAVGGFNPGYQAPANFPTLKRLSLAIGAPDVQMTAQAYVAMTSNTLQFGARIELTAGTSSLNVHGFLGFDALVEWDPFAFSFALSAGVDLRAGGSTLASVHLDGTVAGTSPWHVSGDASVSFLFFDVSVHVDKQWGDTATALPPPDPTPLVIAALQDPSAWIPLASAFVNTVITAAPAPTDAGGALLLDPAGGVRISQSVAPLGQAITRFAGTPLAAPVTLDIDSANVSGATTTANATAEFALAQFVDMTDDQKLSLPSFQPLDAGIDIGGDGIDLGQSGRSRSVATSLAYETTIIDSAAQQRPGTSYVLSWESQLAMHARLVDFATPPPLVTLAAEQYIIAGSADLKARPDVATDGTKHGALTALNAYVTANPAARGQLQVVLASEAA
jgi:hypothetical protein